MTHPLEDITRWISKAVPNPNNKNLHVQLGVHLEEVRELLLELYANDVTTMMLLDATRKNLHDLANRLKCQEGLISFPNRIGTLDAICDQLVTGTALGYMMGMNVSCGLEEVNESNWSKFENGEPLFDQNGKIMKSPNYRKPDLSPFV